MNIYFNIEYKTLFDEGIVINVITANKGGGTTSSKNKMETTDGIHWLCQIKISSENAKTLDYYYSVNKAGKEKRHEWLTIAHRLELTPINATDYTIYDYWLDTPEDTYLYSSAFTDCVNHRNFPEIKPVEYARTLRLIVRAPQLNSGQRLAIVGSGSGLGEWNIQESIPMYEHNFNEWMADIDASAFESEGMEFKFIAMDEKNGDSLMWETGLNRTAEVPKMKDGEVCVYNFHQAFFPIYNAKLAGTLVPIFSLRSKASFGIGDFGDLKKMIDFVSHTNQRVLQVLPINDTTTTHTWTDSYPYSCISIFAIHPQYADLTQLPELKDAETKKTFEALRKELNELGQIDYERVNNAKDEYLRLIFEQEKATVMKSAEFKAFFKESATWLVPYAQYCHLRDTYGTAEFATWPNHNTWDESDRKALSSPANKAYKEVEFYYFVQYILNTQMQAAHEHARKRGVILKGDIPIGVNRNGCDVWMEPEYFNLNSQAGAPPDDFSMNGQNWGFPTYNWDAMLKDGCAWWVRRFQNMSKFFDAYRIDHVLGFFRIWEIPIESVHGLLGQFSPSLGMTREEIESYGLHFQEELFTKPFIVDWVLDRVFGEHADEVREKYVEHTHDDMYCMRPEYDTQRKVETAFIGRTTDKDIWIRDGLYSLISDVLFVRDRKDENKFHPRISVQFDFIFQSLYDGDKTVFNRIYNDYYYRRNNQFWYYEAMKKLPILVQATRMLVCAEDLGMVPDCVAWVTNELRILSLELQSMPKDPKVRFGHLSRNPYRSVCTISSHDMPTLRQWWDENIERTQEYYNTMLYRGGAAPHPLPGWLARDIISRHLTSPSMLCILSIQDWLSIDEKLRLADQNAERINIPANPKNYWRYRMHINIEDLQANKDFCENVAVLVSQSGRK